MTPSKPHKTTRGPKPPPNLQPRAKRFFAEGLVDYGVENDSDCELLRVAATALSRAIDAADAIARDGLTVQGPRGVVRHPAVDIERTSLSTFNTTVEKLLKIRAGTLPKNPGSKHWRGG